MALTDAATKSGRIPLILKIDVKPSCSHIKLPEWHNNTALRQLVVDMLCGSVVWLSGSRLFLYKSGKDRDT